MVLYYFHCLQREGGGLTRPAQLARPPKLARPKFARPLKLACLKFARPAELARRELARPADNSPAPQSKRPTAFL